MKLTRQQILDNKTLSHRMIVRTKGNSLSAQHKYQVPYNLGFLSFFLLYILFYKYLVADWLF